MTESNNMSFKIIALIFSILLHLFVILSVSETELKANTKISTLNLDLIQEVRQKARIVPESEIKQSEKIPETKNRASKNTVVEKEQVKRGFDELAKVRVKTKKKVKARTKIKTKIKNLPTKNLSPNLNPSLSPGLNPDPGLTPSLNTKQDPKTQKPDLTGFTKFRSNSPSNNSGTSASKAAQNLSSYKPFKYIPQGSSTYLPGVSEGEVTLLNAKAEQYAVFVRRVALQVFSSLRSKNWASVTYQQARSGRRFSVIHARMDKTGKLVSINAVESSGSTSFDRVVSSSVKTGLWDKNPALSASLDDGNIHFIFKAKTWAEKAGDPPRERRWLLLSTGLK